MEKAEFVTHQTINPVKYVQALPGGNAHVILCSDGNHYMFKWNPGSRRPKEMVNEYIVGKLAKLLSLPVNPFELIYFNEEFIKSTPELKACSPGLKFGSLVIKDSLVFADVAQDPPSKQKIINSDILAGMIVFDQWIYNSNRNANSLLLQPGDQGCFYVHLIHHDRCFPGGYRWTAKTIWKQKPEYRILNQVYRWAFSLLNDDQQLAAFAEKIKRLPDGWINEVIESIPDEWELSSEEREALYYYLIKEKVRMPKVASLFQQVIPLADQLNI
jgi:hypothetical protein